MAIELAVEGAFTYGIPDRLGGAVCLGSRVLVEFGRKTVSGYVVGLKKEKPEGIAAVKDIVDVMDAEPLFDEKRLSFFKWMSSYYFSPIGLCLALICPPSVGLKSKKRFYPAQKGDEAAEKLADTDALILKACGNGISLPALLRKFKGLPVNAAIERLKKKGFLTEVNEAKRPSHENLERYIEVAGEPLNHDGMQRLKKKSPASALLYGHLLQYGPCRLSALKENFNNAGSSARRLEKNGLARVFLRQVSRDPLKDIRGKEPPSEPTAEQWAAIESILSSVKKKSFSTHLLYGVTGAGKTLVYLKALEEVISAGRAAMLLVPEIALAEWPAAYLMQRFPGMVALLHSSLSAGERADEWRRILSGEARIVVGARSALFSPIKDLGLIIVDEEHEASYKQEEGVKYHARDASVLLGKCLGLTVVLGSATPSVESFFNAKKGRYTLNTLSRRALGLKMPEVQVQDVRGKHLRPISEKLHCLIKDALENNGQAMLLLNRRGFSNFLMCRECGFCFLCPNCSVSLTMHKKERALKCHYCGQNSPIPDTCPKCRGIKLVEPGTGTERVEEEIGKLFPSARIERMDRDTTRRRGSAKGIIGRVEAREVDILVGTQMISKGHDFTGIGLVGIVSGDTSLAIPDFRSAERTFQLITQAAGRAGRRTGESKVLIQTLSPDNYCLKHASQHDYEGFYEEEIAIRKDAGYPPFVRLCILRLEGRDELKVAEAAKRLSALSNSLLGAKAFRRGITILGPCAAPLSRLKGLFRWHMLVKSAEVWAMHEFVRTIISEFNEKKKGPIALMVDVDPAMTV